MNADFAVGGSRSFLHHRPLLGLRPLLEEAAGCSIARSASLQRNPRDTLKLRAFHLLIVAALHVISPAAPASVTGQQRSLFAYQSLIEEEVA